MKFKEKKYLTKKQNRDLETILWFVPDKMLELYPPTKKDIIEFFEYSERGLHKDKFKANKFGDRNGVGTLLQGKRWRGIHIHELYEEGVLDSSVPYHVLLGGYGDIMPRVVVDFLKKEMFKGKDADLIESCYQSIINESNIRPKIY